MPTIFSRIAGDLPGRFVWKDDDAVVPPDRLMTPGHARRPAGSTT
jgi:hypothetical protein